MSAARRASTLIFSRRTLAYAGTGTLVAAAGGYWYLNSGPAYPSPSLQTRRPPPPWTPPSREAMIERLRRSSHGGEEEFDLLVIGGGATGAGVAVDAATRGLKVAMVEKDDFSSGTSSKSTKLVHGGVRYLQKAIMELDYEQWKLVREALHERKIFLQTAPYLSHMLPIMLPIYKYWQVPYYWAGCKLYDLLAGKENMESSYLMSRGKAMEAFPILKSEGLVGALVYYDGQHNDSRMNVALVMTAVRHGATVTNHTEVTQLHKGLDGKLNGARIKDVLTGVEWDVKCKGIINATGPFADSLLSMDNPSHQPIVQAAAGIHITLPNYYSPRTMGLLDPATSDGRVIFFLPWQGNTIAGTTDSAASVEAEPKAPEEEIRWVLEEVRRYLSPDIKVRRGDVLSAWSGLRPLVRNPNAAKTEGLVRNHMIHLSESGLLTIAGGKWTTYRAMAEETVDEAVKAFGLKPTNGCVTDQVQLVGSDGWSRNMFVSLIQRYGLETEVARHLSDNYGDRAWTVCAFAESTGASWPLHGVRLSRAYPFIEAEVRYAVRHEYAQTAVDVIARRTRLSFLNAQAALDAIPRVVDIMAAELGWSYARKASETQAAAAFLASMGLPQASLPLPAPIGAVEKLQHAIRGSASFFAGGEEVIRTVPLQRRAQFEHGEVETLMSAFQSKARVVPASSGEAEVKRLDKAELQGLVNGLAGFEGIKAKDVGYVLDAAGFAQREDLDLDEFIEICAELKDVLLTPVASADKARRRRIPVERTGGGV